MREKRVEVEGDWRGGERSEKLRGGKEKGKVKGRIEKGRVE